jgi:hypothetical protein
MLAAIHRQSLFTVNCHMHTESSDFLGGLRPVREHTSVSVLSWIPVVIHPDFMYIELVVGSTVGIKNGRICKVVCQFYYDF